MRRWMCSAHSFFPAALRSSLSSALSREKDNKRRTWAYPSFSAGRHQLLPCLSECARSFTSTVLCHLEGGSKGSGVDDAISRSTAGSSTIATAKNVQYGPIEMTSIIMFSGSRDFDRSGRSWDRQTLFSLPTLLLTCMRHEEFESQQRKTYSQARKE